MLLKAIVMTEKIVFVLEAEAHRVARTRVDFKIRGRSRRQSWLIASCKERRLYKGPLQERDKG